MNDGRFRGEPLVVHWMQERRRSDAISSHVMIHGLLAFASWSRGSRVKAGPGFVSWFKGGVFVTAIPISRDWKRREKPYVRQLCPFDLHISSD